LNRSIVRDALRTFETLRTPGAVAMLPYEWADDDAWKDTVMRPRASSSSGAAGSGSGAAGSDSGARDDRVERVATPQYQSSADQAEADATLASGGCATCVWLDGVPAQGAPSAHDDAPSRDDAPIRPTK
jgi:hypothetical protein